MVIKGSTRKGFNEIDTDIYIYILLFMYEVDNLRELTVSPETQSIQRVT